MWLPGGHAWLPVGMCSCWEHAWVLGGCVVVGGMHGCWGACRLQMGMCG